MTRRAETRDIALPAVAPLATADQLMLDLAARIAADVRAVDRATAVLAALALVPIACLVVFPAIAAFCQQVPA